MVVKIRLARFGRTNAPFYNIVVAHARRVHPNQAVAYSLVTTRRESPNADLSSLALHRTARNSKPLEVIGTYDPIPKKDSYDESGKLHKDIRLDIDRAKYWVGVGAQPTDTVWRFLSMLGILEPKYRPKAKSPPAPS
ncbi:cytochrome-21 [Diaporthe helianthi]|uniref:Cytochrome-21 n=1 Tax=Diaporthe helianthi TaxID=158607 RepID=A0A2P5IFB8_DIAHE|nr:cytochrome-21 [Diaporthe helianthi]